jgi:hypothetical protein
LQIYSPKVGPLDNGADVTVGKDSFLGKLQNLEEGVYFYQEAGKNQFAMKIIQTTGEIAFINSKLNLGMLETYVRYWYTLLRIDSINGVDTHDWLTGIEKLQIGIDFYAKLVNFNYHFDSTTYKRSATYDEICQGRRQDTYGHAGNFMTFSEDLNVQLCKEGEKDKFINSSTTKKVLKRKLK